MPLILLFLSIGSFNSHAMEQKKLIDVSGVALGLPIKSNENVYLKTSGLIMCTGLVVTDGVNTLLGHIVHDKNPLVTQKLIEHILKKIQSVSLSDNKNNIKVTAYYVHGNQEGEAKANDIVKIAQGLSVKNASIIPLDSSEVIINIHGKRSENIINPQIFFLQNYKKFLDGRLGSLFTEKNAKAMKEFEHKLEKEGKMWIISEYNKLRNKNTKKEYHDKVINTNSQDTFDEYEKLKTKNLFNSEQHEKELLESIKKQHPIENYIKEEMQLNNPWVVETGQSEW